MKKLIKQISKIQDGLHAAYYFSNNDLKQDWSRSSDW